MTNDQQQMPRHTALLALCLVLWGALWFAAPGYRDLIDPDESRYAEIPREMLASGDWVTPRLNDLAYFEKPPLQYWVTALAYKLFGVNETTARLWIVLFGAFGVSVVFLLARALHNTATAIFAALVCSSSLLYVALSHFLTLDLTLGVCLFAGIAALIRAQQLRASPPAAMRWMLVAWFALACGFMTKGLVALVLPGGAVVLYSVWQRDWNLWRHLHLGKGLLLVAVLCTPWFVLMQARHPNFLEFFFVHEHFQRYTTNTNHHEAPLWFFAAMFLVGMLPWSFSAARAMLRPSFAFARGDGSFNAERLLWLYIVVVIAFFSLSGSKLPAYILPALPAAAVLVAPQLQRDGLPVADVGIAVLFGCVVVLLAVLLPAHLPSGVPLEMALNYRPWLFAAGCALLATGLLAYLQRRHIAAAITAIALGTILATQLLLCGFQALAPLRSSKQVAEVIRQQPLRADTPIYMVDEYTPSLPFYLQRPATIVVARSELGPGIDAEPQKWLETPEKFAKRWQNDTFAVAVIANEDFDTYDRSDIPMRIVYRGSRDTVVIPLR